MGEWKYNSKHSKLWHWMEVSGQLHALAAFTLGEESIVPLYRSFVGPRTNLDIEKREVLNFM
jgi:hypothetical protein